jgi:hypothetical protein
MAGLGDQEPPEVLERNRLRLPDDDERVGLRAGEAERLHQLVRPAFELALECLHRKRELEQRIHEMSVPRRSDDTSRTGPRA